MRKLLFLFVACSFIACGSSHAPIEKGLDAGSAVEEADAQASPTDEPNPDDPSPTPDEDAGPPVVHPEDPTEPNVAQSCEDACENFAACNHDDFGDVIECQTECYGAGLRANATHCGPAFDAVIDCALDTCQDIDDACEDELEEYEDCIEEYCEDHPRDHACRSESHEGEGRDDDDDDDRDEDDGDDHDRRPRRR